MGTYNPRRLCRPDILRAIDSDCLEELLVPHAKYLAERGVTLPLKGRDAPLKYLALVQMFASPRKDMPSDLIDALYFVDELATPSGVEALESAAEACGIRLTSPYDLTPGDVALRFWLKHRWLVEKVHAEMAVRRFRAYSYFQPSINGVPKLPDSLEAPISAIEAELNEHFHAKRRGEYARVFVDEQKDCVWLYVGHGGLLRREGTIEETGPSSICYRPEVYDALVYIRESGELGVHAASKWERELYREILGKHLFGDARFFTGTAKYVLDPIRRYGQQVLTCLDVPGIEWVRLVQLMTFQPSRMPRTENHRSEDLFASWGETSPPFSRGGRLISAGFRVKILGCPNPRLVTIRPPQHAQYSRDVDRVWIERWLELRGFIRQRKGAGDAGDPTVLAVA